MLVTILIAMLCGAILGFRFRVYVLLPATAVIAVVGGTTGLTLEGGLLRAALTVAACLIALQVGYLMGAMSRALRQPRRVSVPQTDERPRLVVSNEA